MGWYGDSDRKCPNCDKNTAEWEADNDMDSDTYMYCTKCKCATHQESPCGAFTIAIIANKKCDIDLKENPQDLDDYMEETGITNNVELLNKIQYKHAPPLIYKSIIDKLLKDGMIGAKYVKQLTNKINKIVIEE
jgi:hypothetical protein